MGLRIHHYKLIEQAVGQGTVMLGPVPSDTVFDPVDRLADGSFLFRVYPSSEQRKRDQDGVVVRTIEYTCHPR